MSDSVHNGHRDRLKKRYSEHGLDNFDDHNVLELLLTYAIPRRDVNELAHEIIEHFGSFAAVFDAEIEELKQVKGVGENAATLIKLVLDVNRRYLLSRAERGGKPILKQTDDAGEFFMPYFYGEHLEKVYVACLDDNFRLIACHLMFEGGLSSAAISVRKLAEVAIADHATNLILAHNHPVGSAMPSVEDVQATINIARGLRAVEISLLDHMIVADGEYLSMEELGFLSAVQ